jgi:hypothetical protein
MFKILSAVAAWLLFLMSIQGTIWTFVDSSDKAPLEIVAFFSLWMVTLFLSVVAMKLHAKMKD